MAVYIKPGDVLTNQQLWNVFRVGNSGGMRMSTTENALIVISNHTKSLFEDKWIGNEFHYCGMGQTGNQDLNYRQNNTLNESNSNGIDLFLFESFKSNEYLYQGMVKLVKKPYLSQQPDKNLNMRDVWIFPLNLIHGHPISVNPSLLQNIKEKNEEKVKKISDEKLRKIAEKITAPISKKSSSVTTYNRNPFIVAYALRRAEGICQLCDNNAPFFKKNREPYLEVHHIIHLANNGPDVISNTVALCPNCHRKMHILNLPGDINKLNIAAKKKL